ncbi:hypothetical protein XENTR_v10005570 [Xenopus tropicalis]|nr:hypothetical protein XENTR_v10005570 [Xenopus tropicalis]
MLVLSTLNKLLPATTLLNGHSHGCNWRTVYNLYTWLLYFCPIPTTALWANYELLHLHKTTAIAENQSDCWGCF